MALVLLLTRARGLHPTRLASRMSDRKRVKLVLKFIEALADVFLVGNHHLKQSVVIEIGRTE